MKTLVRAAAVLSSLALAPAALADFGYGVNARGDLFRFPLANPSSVTTIGTLPFVPEGIDFRPGTADLYAVDVGATSTQLFRIDIQTASATAIGAGFASQGGGGAGGYNLTGGQTFGFDFNPTTLQPDNSMRIRLVSSGGSNLRLNSGTGGVAAIDGLLSYGGNPTPGVDAAAYINSANGTAGGATTLFVMDAVNNQLAIQSPPNAGALTAVGAFGVTIDALANISFDILTDPNSVDTGIGGDAGYAVLRRPDAPINGPLGAYLIYNVNLGTGQLTSGNLVGNPLSPEDFSGGFAVSTFVPSPSAVGLMLLGLTASARRRR